MLGLRAASSKLTFNLVKNAIPKPAIRFNSSTNFNDPESRKPTLEIDSFAKSKRLNRPISPHLFIYQPQLTWVLSGLNRATGGAIAALFYFTAVSYAVLPVDTGALVAYVHSYPGGLLFLAKVALGFPIFFHSINGIRHLVWDTASQLTLKGVYNTGYAVLGATGLFTAVYALFF